MSRQIATVLSWVFHPVWLTPVLAWLIIRANPVLFSGKDQGLILILTAVLTVLMPVLSLLILRGLGMIDSLELDDRKQRTIPMIAIATFYLWAYFGLLKPGLPTLISSPSILADMLLGGSIVVGLTFAVNSVLKVSLHTAGVGAAIGVLWNVLPMSSGSLLVPFLVAILIAGLVGTARLALGKHTLSEIMLGYFVGFVGQFAAYQVL